MPPPWVTTKDPKYWESVLDTIRLEEERRAQKRSSFESLTLKDYKSRIQAYVHKVLTRKEWQADQKAVEAVQKEGAALIEAGTWLLDTVIEKEELIKKARTEGKTIHMADLLSTCTIKHWEIPELRRYKGRICYRGDCTKDEYGAAAIHQDLSSSPTTIQGANANIAYGASPGNGTSTADAVRAYVQALLKSLFETWVAVPFELWPKDGSWKGMWKPMCKLEKALYGHPESGAHWEAHLTESVVSLGGIAVQNFPSTFWFEKERLLLTVYVDDLLLSGPVGNHQQFWERLQRGTIPIRIDPPEALDRFLGRRHIMTPLPAPKYKPKSPGWDWPSGKI
jgi:hypothetical protein